MQGLGHLRGESPFREAACHTVWWCHASRLPFPRPAYSCINRKVTYRLHVQTALHHPWGIFPKALLHVSFPLQMPTVSGSQRVSLASRHQLTAPSQASKVLGLRLLWRAAPWLGVWKALAAGGLQVLPSLSQAWQTPGRVRAVNSCSGSASFSLFLT